MSTSEAQGVGAARAWLSAGVRGDDVSWMSSVVKSDAVLRALDRVPDGQLASVLVALFDALASGAEASGERGSGSDTASVSDIVSSEVSPGSSVSSKGARRRARKRARAAAALQAGGVDSPAVPAVLAVADPSPCVGSVCGSAASSVSSLAPHLVVQAVDGKAERVRSYGAGYCYLWAVARDFVDGAAAVLGSFPTVAQLLGSPVLWWEPVAVMASLRARVDGAEVHVVSPYCKGIVGDTRFFTLCRSAVTVSFDRGTLGALAQTCPPGVFPLGDATGFRVGAPTGWDGLNKAASVVMSERVSLEGCGTYVLSFSPELHESVVLRTSDEWSLVVVRTRATGSVLGFIPYLTRGSSKAALRAMADRVLVQGNVGFSQFALFQFPVARVRYKGGKSIGSVVNMWRTLRIAMTVEPGILSAMGLTEYLEAVLDRAGE